MIYESTALDTIFDSPSMPELLEVMNGRWNQEKRLREEFYEKIQPGDKWEFINGKIIMHSPAKDKHTDARENLAGILRIYADMHESGTIYSETALVTLTRNDYLPDIVFFSKEKAVHFTPNTWKYPAADFAVEVLSDSTESKDRGTKKEDYAAHGTQEYWLVDTDAQTVEQFLLDKELREFKLFAKKTIDDHITCHLISGLSFPVLAIFNKKEKLKVLAGWFIGNQV